MMPRGTLRRPAALPSHEPGRAALRRGHWRTSADARTRVPAGFKIQKRDQKVIEALHEPNPPSPHVSHVFVSAACFCPSANACQAVPQPDAGYGQNRARLKMEYCRETVCGAVTVPMQTMNPLRFPNKKRGFAGARKSHPVGYLTYSWRACEISGLALGGTACCGPASRSAGTRRLELGSTRALACADRRPRRSEPCAIAAPRGSK
jgi:hypothetical protein